MGLIFLLFFAYTYALPPCPEQREGVTPDHDRRTYKMVLHTLRRVLDRFPSTSYKVRV